MHDWKESDKKTEWSEIADQNLEMKYYKHMWDLLHVKHGVSYKRWENFDGRKIKFLSNNLYVDSFISFA